MSSCSDLTTESSCNDAQLPAGGRRGKWEPITVGDEISDIDLIQ